MTQKDRLLIIGYGNTFCHDDGVGLFVVNRLRKEWGTSPLQPDEDGLDGLNGLMDAVILHQLIPEMVPVVTKYDVIIFVDAHTGTIPEEIRIVQVEEKLGFHAVTHHMSPGMLLAMVRQTGGPVPRAYLVSIKGEDFDFGLGLSVGCEARAKKAVQKILDLIQTS